MRLNQLLIACCIFFLACNDQPADSEPAALKPDKKDSTPAYKPERPSVNPYAGVDVSPMDMVYYPIDYPKLKMTHIISTAPLARVIYSRPHLQGRHIFHEVLKYDEPWRLGANEATELTLYKDAIIQDKKIKAGRYTLYCIPHKDTWTIALNSNIDTWGLERDIAKDIARFEVPVQQTQNSLEYFTMVFEDEQKGPALLMAWDDVEVRLPFRF